MTVTYTPPAPPGPATTITSDGTYAVGTDIQPGVYRTAGSATPGLDCYYKRLASFQSSDIIDNEGTEGPQVVEIFASDAASLRRTACPGRSHSDRPPGRRDRFGVAAHGRCPRSVPGRQAGRRRR